MPTASADDTTDDAASREARRLIRSMRKDLRAIAAFLDAEEQQFERRPATAKRVARLRLISQDLSSGRHFITGDRKR